MSVRHVAIHRSMNQTSDPSFAIITDPSSVPPLPTLGGGQNSKEPVALLIEL